MTLKTIVQDACDRLSLPRPAAVAASTDQSVRVLFGIAKQEGRELATRTAWQALRGEKTFTATATEMQTGSIPSDFGWYIPDTMFNRTSRRKVDGPLSPIEWQETKATLVTRVNPAFRIMGDAIYITQTPSAGDVFAYEYVSKNWCQSESGAAQSVWLADSDVPLLNEEFHILGIVWRFKKSKGFEYAEDYSLYERMVGAAIIRDGGKPRISTDGVGLGRVPRAPQIPETYVVS